MLCVLLRNLKNARDVNCLPNLERSLLVERKEMRDRLVRVLVMRVHK